MFDLGSVDKYLFTKRRLYATHLWLKVYSYGQKSCRVKCLDAIYAHTLWKAISPEPLGLQYLILHIWNLCVKTNNLSTFGGLCDPPLKSLYNLKNEEKKIKIVKNRFFFQLAQF